MRASLPVTRRIRHPSPVMALLLVLGSALLPASGPAQEQRPTEIRVTARQPGPPLWRVTHGENTLWILPLVSAIPRGLHWDTTRLERILGESEEFIHAPDVDLDISKLVLLNPVNWVRGYRLAKRLGEHPEGKTLEESLPPALHARYAAIRDRYFPKEKKDYERQRPAFVAGRMLQRVLEAEKLDGGTEVRKELQRLLRKQRKLVRTEVGVEERLEGGFGALRDRAVALVDSLTADQELQCFADQVERIERHVGDMKEVAEAWASGDAADLQEYLRRSDASDPCYALMLASSEGAFIQRLLDESSARWIEAADQALRTRRSSVAVLNLNQIIGEGSPVEELLHRGHTLHSPR